MNNNSIKKLHHSYNGANKKHISNVVVYCGSRPGDHPIFGQEAGVLGQSLAQGQYALTYGSGGAGLMKLVAESAVNGSGEVYGINVHIFAKQGEAPKGVVERSNHGNMFERKAEMIKLTQASIALGGGLGTFDEVGESLVDNDIKKHRDDSELLKPVLLVNHQIENEGGYYDELLVWLKKSLKHQFANASIGTFYAAVPSARHAVLMLDVLNQQGPVTAREAQERQIKSILKPEFQKIYMEQAIEIPVPVARIDGRVDALVLQDMKRITGNEVSPIWG